MKSAGENAEFGPISHESQKESRGATGTVSERPRGALAPPAAPSTARATAAGHKQRARPSPLCPQRLRPALTPPSDLGHHVLGPNTALFLFIFQTTGYATNIKNRTEAGEQGPVRAAILLCPGTCTVFNSYPREYL